MNVPNTNVLNFPFVMNGRTAIQEIPKSTGKVFIESNTTEITYREVKDEHIIPVFSATKMDINLSLIKSDVLYNIWNGFKKAQHKIFPYNLLMKDALISDEKILRALKVT